MLKANKFEFSDKKIDALPYVEKMYSNSVWLRNGLEEAKLKLRVYKTKKSFCLYFNERLITLGKFTETYGVAHANSDALRIMTGTLTPNPESRGMGFGKLGAKIFDDKESKGRSFVDVNRRKFFNNVPRSILEKQINKITREDVIAWKETFLRDKSQAYWNKVLEVPTNIWNEASKTYAFSLLENRRNPFSCIKEEVAKQTYPVPTFNQLKEIWRALRSHGHQKVLAIVKLKILTGMHFSEIQKLRLRHIQGEWLVMDVGQHKNSNNQNQIRHKIYLSPQVLKLVKTWVDMFEVVEPDQLLFSHTGVTPISDKSFNSVWLRATRSANLDFRFDRLRHCLITDMKNSDHDPKYITGHCYLENTASKFYTDWDSEAMANKFKQVNLFWQTKVYNLVNNMWF